MSRDILLSLIDPDRGQPRQNFDEDKLAELAASMDAKGLIQPIMVRPNGDDGRFAIVHGERRYRAALSLGWDTIRAEVRDVDADEAHWLALIENVQRRDLSPIEEARAYQGRLAEGITQTELGKRIGKSQSYIAQKLRLLKLPTDVQAAVGDGIAEGHARQLLKLGDSDQQNELCQRAKAEEWTVAQMQEAVDLIRPITLEEKAEFERCERVIGDYLSQLRKASHPPNPDNFLEVAIWGEQRIAYLNTQPVTTLLGRQNDIAAVRLWLEWAAGGALNALEREEGTLMTWCGLLSIVEVLEPGHQGRRSILCNIIKQIYEACPGIEVTPTSLEIPEDATFEQWKALMYPLAELAALAGIK